MENKTYKYFEALNFIAGDIIAKGPVSSQEPKLLKLREEAVKSDDWYDYDKELDEVLDRHFNHLGQDAEGDDEYALKEKEANNG